ncbi:MAG TPA: TetR/AcrR family transcriptional regulator [Acidimicrobiales bacterium]|nr:TetR/AcrR family transcriptional regulator [Acidimicrobiales bacterium]
MDQTNDTERRVDGRTARRDRNRLAVLDAVLELFSEGNLDPGVHEVADRSGVSLRSVYRYFEDLDELVTAAIDRHLDRTRPLFEIEDLGVGPFHDRVHRFIERRLRLFENIRVIYRASRVRAATDPGIQSGIAATHQWLTDQTHRMFEPELEGLDEPAATDTRRTVDLLTQFDSLEHLRHRCGLGPEETAAYLRRSLTQVLT